MPMTRAATEAHTPPASSASGNGQWAFIMSSAVAYAPMPKKAWWPKLR